MRYSAPGPRSSFLRFSFVLFLSLLHRVFDRIFCLAHCVLDFSFGLLCRSLDLHFLVPGPFSSLTLNPACHILHFALNPILIHCESSLSRLNFHQVLTRRTLSHGENENHRVKALESAGFALGVPDRPASQNERAPFVNFTHIPLLLLTAP